MQSFKDLKVWQLGMDVAAQVYSLTQSLPKHEIYGLSSQLQRSAVSIPSNIAEGHARDSSKDFLRHLSVARGSLAELETQLILAERMQYVTSTQTQQLRKELDELSRMLRGLQKSIRARLEPRV